ncbi:MAG: hypothetical protein AAFQ63_21455 [Cyanobacteria bacterium J06621_11]
MPKQTSLLPKSCEYAPDAELDELVLSLTIQSVPAPVCQRIESYSNKEFPGWTMRNWWTTANAFDENEPF